MIDYNMINSAMNIILNQNIDDKINEKIIQNEELVYFLKENKILIRFFDVLDGKNIKIKESIKRLLIKEKIRVKNVKLIIDKIGLILKDYSENYIVFKNFQHFPDMGDDIDLLIIDNHEKILRLLINNFNVKLKEKTIFNKISNKTMLIDFDNKFEIELHDNTLGRFGEFQLNNLNLKDFVKIENGLCTPKIQFQMIINIIQRIYTRSYIRVSEMMFFKENTGLYEDNLFWSGIKSLNIIEGANLYEKLNSSFYEGRTKRMLESFNFKRNKYIKFENSIFYIKLRYSLPLILKNILNKYKR